MTNAADASDRQRATANRSEDGVTVTDAVLIRHPVGNVSAVRNWVNGQGSREADDGGCNGDGRATDRGGVACGPSSRLLPSDDVLTVDLFVRKPEVSEKENTADADTGVLVWYVEHTGTGWDDPVDTLVDRSPLYGPDGPLTRPDSATSFTPFLHAINPARPAHSAAVDVVLVPVAMAPGLGTLLARALGGFLNAIRGTRVERALLSAGGEVLKEESMWTESLFLDVEDGRAVFLWYMEAENMDHVMTAYDESENVLTKVSDRIFELLVAQPLSALGDPMAATEYVLLAHVIDP